MRRTWGAVVVALVVTGVLAVAGPTRAGGNWIDIHRSIRIGTTVTARGVFFTRSEARVREGGPYFAYLSRYAASLPWGLPDPSKPGTIRVGRVEVLWPDEHEFRGMLRNNPRGVVTFQVPEVPTGRYTISFCDRACERPLGDVDVTGPIWVVQTAMEGKLGQKLDAKHMLFREARYGARSFRGRLYDARIALDGATAEATRARAQVTELETTVDRLRGAPPERSINLTLLVLAFLLGVTGGAAVAWRIGHVVLDRRLRRLVDAGIDELAVPEASTGARDPVSMPR